MSRLSPETVMQTSLSIAVDKVPGMFYQPGFADPAQLFPLIETICVAAPLRHMETTRGFRLAAAQTNCGELGWVSDRRGYRYEPQDPLSGKPWPALPAAFLSLASRSASVAGYQDFKPDACLVNCYYPPAGMSAHSDSDEKDFDQPIVSVSLGLPVRFFIKGAERTGKAVSLDLQSGDVVVWGGESRRYYHGVRPLKEGDDCLFGNRRINLTFRKAA